MPTFNPYPSAPSPTDEPSDQDMLAVLERLTSDLSTAPTTAREATMNSESAYQERMMRDMYRHSQLQEQYYSSPIGRWGSGGGAGGSLGSAGSSGNSQRDVTRRIERQRNESMRIDRAMFSPGEMMFEYEVEMNMPTYERAERKEELVQLCEGVGSAWGEIKKIPTTYKRNYTH